MKTLLTAVVSSVLRTCAKPDRWSLSGVLALVVMVICAPGIAAAACPTLTFTAVGQTVAYDATSCDAYGVGFGFSQNYDVSSVFTVGYSNYLRTSDTISPTSSSGGGTLRSSHGTFTFTGTALGEANDDVDLFQVTLVSLDGSGAASDSITMWTDPNGMGASAPTQRSRTCCSRSSTRSTPTVRRITPARSSARSSGVISEARASPSRRRRLETSGTLKKERFVYVHGYDQNENVRLADQADTLVTLLHGDTVYPAGASVLEAGCGVGAQTITLARNSPNARFTSIDISAASVTAAAQRVANAGFENVAFRQADIFALPFAAESFDHVFVCFVLEHLSDPGNALATLLSVLKPGGTITVIEGDHGSTYFLPDSAAARAAVACQTELQRRAGGNANVGRSVYPLLRAAGFADVAVAPLMVYVDGSRPDLIDGFTRKTFTAMIRGVRDAAIAAELTEADAFDAGIRDLERTAANDGVFCYTFFKGVARKPAR
jgi:SAM-dependent methyltransferase